MKKALSVADIFSIIKEKEIKFVDFRFTDYNGKWIHITHCANQVSEESLTRGVSFDGSSVPAWKKINESDMILMPQLNSIFVDPFCAEPTISLICDVIEPTNNKGYERDPRHTAKLAEEYLKSTGIGDAAYFGPEPEFFIFDSVRFKSGAQHSFYQIESEEDAINNETEYELGNLGHRSAVKSSYFDSSPTDRSKDLRNEIVKSMEEVGLEPLLHHHEVANSQSEIGFQYSTLVETADNVQKFKYVAKNTAAAYGKTITFMPKPVLGDNGSGMHVHQSIWKEGKPLFLGDGYANLSDMALYYIGGIIKHAKSLNAFTNPSTNSYKRLVPGFEAPVILAYSAKNRSASIRIPHVTNQKAKRIETRFPDPVANPYLAFSAMLMAGLDGIKNKIHPGNSDDRDLYDLSDKQLKKIPNVARSLEEALNALSRDRAFLKQGGVFTDEQIDAYISLKRQEVEIHNNAPNPCEFEMYYSC